MILLVPLRCPWLGDLCCFKQSHWLFFCHRHWNSSLVTARYLITTASKQAHVRLLERKRLFPAGSLFVPSFMLFSHHDIKYCPNLALRTVPHTDDIYRAGISEVGFLSAIPSLLTGLLIIWTLRSIELKYITIYACRVGLVGFFFLFRFGVFLCGRCFLHPFFLLPAALRWRWCLEGVCLGEVRLFLCIQAYRPFKLCAWNWRRLDFSDKLMWGILRMCFWECVWVLFCFFWESSSQLQG